MPSRRKKKPNSTTRPQLQGGTIRPITENRRARRDYAIVERIEAGIVLTGTEIKSVRAARINIGDSYAQVRNGELWLYNMHISSWGTAGLWNHDPVRTRKLLLHRAQVSQLARLTSRKGLTLIPLRMYIKNHHAKLEIALAQGRRRYDKRQVVIKRETEREINRALRSRNR